MVPLHLISMTVVDEIYAITYVMFKPIVSWKTLTMTSMTEIRAVLTNSQDSQDVLCPIAHSAWRRNPAPIWTGFMVSSTIAASHR